MFRLPDYSGIVSRAAWPVFAIGAVLAIGNLCSGCAGSVATHTATFSDRTPVHVVDVIDGEALRTSVRGTGILDDIEGPIRPVSIAPTNTGGLIIGDLETRGVLLTDATRSIRFSTASPYSSQFSKRTAPRFVRQDLAGSIYVVDAVNERVRVYDDKLVAVSDIEPPYQALGLPQGQLSGLAFGGYGEMYVADRLNARVYQFDASGVHIGDFGSDDTPWARLNRPMGVACDDYDGSVYVCDSGERRVAVFDNTGALLRTFGQAELREPVAVAVDRSGQVFVVDYARRAIAVFARDGTFLGAIDGPRLGLAGLIGPTDIAIRNDLLFVADPENHRILKVRYSGHSQDQDEN